MKNFISFKYLKGDLFGGITAGIVALPLALAFGEQSGLGAASGLYGAAIIAFFAALFGGTPTQISGPTAPMTALGMISIAAILQANEGQIDKALPTILFVFLLAGIFQILLGVGKVGTFIKYIPYTVVSGFMSGIGVIIIITQILPSIGYYSGDDQKVIESFKPQAEELILERILREEAGENILVLEDFRETIKRAHEISPTNIELEAKLLAQNDSKGVIGSLKYLVKGLRHIDPIEILLALVTIIIILGFKRITTAIPSTLVAIAIVTPIAYFIKLDYRLINEIPAGIPELHLDIFSDMKLGKIAPYVGTAFLLAMLGAIDSLLTSVVADNMTKTRHNPNRELVGQGIGNGIAALFGGLPGAGATIRTVVNIKAGGKTKLSGMIAGIFLFVIIIALGPIASKIPAAVLAGILITVGFGVMDYKGLKVLFKMQRYEVFILLLVLVLTVFWQLVGAVGIGLVISAMIFMKKMGDLSASEIITRDFHDEATRNHRLWEDEVTLKKEIKDLVFFKHLEGPLFFGFVSHFREIMVGLPSRMRVLVIRMERVPFIDQSGLYALEESIQELYEKNIIVLLSGPREQPLKMMKRMDIITKHIPTEHVFSTFDDCRKWLRETLTNQEALESEIKSLKQLKGHWQPPEIDHTV